MRIPWDRLPPGFAETVADLPDDPAEPRPAATIVLMREGERTPEVLLLQRVRSSGFVPGAWVFPGGRVDRADADPRLLRRVVPAGAPARLAERLGVGAAEGGPAAALGYLTAALREAFEETGIPVGWVPADDPNAAPDSGAITRIRTRLLDDELDWLETLEALDLRIDADRIAYLAHWVTPIQEPRRYDARFFLAEVPTDTPFDLDEREMSAGRWLPVGRALELHGTGELPMVFPTIRTLEGLRDFTSVEDALDHYRGQRIPRILPRLVAEEEGVRMVVD